MDFQRRLQNSDLKRNPFGRAGSEVIYQRLLLPASPCKRQFVASVEDHFAVEELLRNVLGSRP